MTVLVDSLDRLNMPEFKAEAAKVISQSDGRLEVDCSTLGFIDSSGLGAFLYAHNLLGEGRQPMRLTGVGSEVLTILELMQVHRLFELEPKR
ncbi:hypothetical protein GCM10023212_00620 [Luteolibacter yonseiensis]